MTRMRSSGQRGTQAWKFVRVRGTELPGEAALVVNGEFLPSFLLWGFWRCALRVRPGVSSLCVQPICYPVPGVSRALSVALSLPSDRYVATEAMLTSRWVNRPSVDAAGAQFSPESC